jgi:hypothetical protein
VIALVAMWLTAADPSTAPTPLPLPLPPPATPPPALTLTEPTTGPVRSWAVPIGHTVGVLVGMRLSLSLIWPRYYDPFPLERSSHQFGRAYNQPPEFRNDRGLLESDGDPWSINIIGHGLFGAEIYGRVRQCGGAPWQALAFTAGTSLLWEYGIESFHKRPSGVDLILTPLLGAALGEGRVQFQRWLRGKPRGFWRRFGEIVIDPLGEGERGILKTRC